MTTTLTRHKGKFVKGQSGNPGGRTKALVEVQTAAREKSTRALETLDKIMADKKAPAQARVAAANSLLDRAFGKPPQSIGEGEAEGLIVQILKFRQDAQS